MPLATPLTIAQELEARRLAHRAARLERVIAALEDRRTFREATGDEAPAPLRAAIAGFRAELQEVQARRAELHAA